MELREFISTVLVSVVRGVEDAQEQLENSNAIVNPLGLKASIALRKNEETPEFPRIEFEVAVQVDSRGEKGGEVGVQVAVFRMGVSSKKQDAQSHISKLRVSVPIHLPPGRVLKPAAKTKT